MNKKLATYLALLVILAFIGYMIFDTARLKKSDNSSALSENDSPPDKWEISNTLTVKEGSLKAVTVSSSGDFYIGGDSFVSCYERDLKLKWTIKTPFPITALSISGDTIFASTMDLILIINTKGDIKDEWGPFEDNGIITSVTANKDYISFADAGNKMIFILDKKGVVKKLIGQNDGQFVIPSPYFDVVLGFDNTLYVANTGHRRIETRSTDGELLSYFGEPGTAPEAFCGCCNPAHFISIPEGFVTAEKGINRIKIINSSGGFVEYVSSRNKFMASVPLDLASSDGKTIYAANPSDSKLYIFTRLN
jgi:hypothetical protein